MDTKSYNIRVPKRWARITMVVGVTALFVAPLTAVATHTFNDVPTTHTFHADIEWLEASGVTKGCNPPANTQFCPDDNVTRGQMSAFMKRFAGYIGAEDGTPAQADNATNANNADTLDGSPAEVYLNQSTVTVITYTGSTTNNAVGSSFEKMRDVGSFTKVDADTSIRLRLNSHGTKSAAGVSCAFQVRVDGTTSSGSAFDGTETIVNSETRTPLANETYFEGLGSGNHTASLWVRGAGSPDCTDNSGNFGRTLIVEEVDSSVDVSSAAVLESATSDEGDTDE
jgi:hypothetical protein